MNVLISGGTGLIGSTLTHSLRLDGHDVWILTRDPARVQNLAGAETVGWDGRSSQGWLDVFSQMDVVVNLAGETTGRWPYTEARKQRIRNSRVQAGQAMAEAFEKAGRKPRVLIQSSGIVGFYGPPGSQPLTESAQAGNDFFGGVVRDWEASSSSVDALAGVRRAVIRTSLVLDAHDGVLPLMALPVRLFAGGPLGNGQQGISWIHLEDEIRAIRFLIDNEQARGPFNLSSPNPVSSAAFIRALAKQLGRPYWFPVPAFALKLLLGGMSALLLNGQYAVPQRLQELGFTFKYERVEDAFRAMFPRPEKKKAFRW